MPARGSASQSHHVLCWASCCPSGFLGIFMLFWKRPKPPSCLNIVLLVTFFVPVFAGLQILYTLLQNVAQEETAAQSFYQTYFCDILQHIFSVVTDTSHTAGENVPACEAGDGNRPFEHQNNVTRPVLNNNCVCLIFDLCRFDNACVNPCLHVQLGRRGKNKYSFKPWKSSEQPNVYSGVRG